MSFKRCILCGNERNYLLFKQKIKENTNFNLLSSYVGGKEFSYFRCPKCRLIFIKPLLSPEYLTEYYRSLNIDPSAEETPYQPLISEIMKFKKAGNFLDVGFGSGEIIRLAKKQGFKVFGVEQNLKSISYFANFCTIYTGDFLDLDLKEDFFDVVCFNTILEHLPNPLLAVKKAYKILREEGIILITVPNFGLSARLLRGSWLYLSPLIGHNSCYSKWTIKYLFQNTGFHPLSIKTSALDPTLTPCSKHPYFINFLSKMENILGDKFLPMIKLLNLGDVLLAIGKKKKDS